MVVKEFLRRDTVVVAMVLPSEETRWVRVSRADVVDEDVTRKVGNGRRRLARVGDEVGRYA